MKLRTNTCWSSVSNFFTQSTIDLLNLMAFPGNDGHQSDYDFEFLKKFQSKVKSPLAFHLWNKETFTDAVESSCRCMMKDYVSDVEVRVQVLKSLQVHGVAFIDGAEPTQDCTEAVVRKLFPVHKTFFGEMRTFSEAQKDLNIAAYTNGELMAAFQLIFIEVHKFHRLSRPTQR